MKMFTLNQGFSSFSQMVVMLVMIGEAFFFWPLLIGYRLGKGVVIG